MGRNCISEVLKANPERLIEVFTCQKPGGDELYTKLQKAGIKLIDRSKKQLEQMVESTSHQSYVAKVHKRANVDLKTFLKEEKSHSLVLMLDSIYDPQNLGAILRASECFGVDLVIFSKNRGADITPTVSKTSVGASELVRICPVSNLHDTLKILQKEGYWSVVADGSEKAQELNHFDFPEKTVLVMGSEGKGVQPLLKKCADFHVKIPMLGQIDSLNVSQATAVILSSYRQN